MNPKVEHIFTHSPFARISIWRNFDVDQFWFLPSFNDQISEQACNLDLLTDLQQLTQHPTRIPDSHENTPNILSLFLNYSSSLFYETFILWSPPITNLFPHFVIMLLYSLRTQWRGGTCALCLNSEGRPDEILVQSPVEWLLLPGQRPLYV